MKKDTGIYQNSKKIILITTQRDITNKNKYKNIIYNEH